MWLAVQEIGITGIFTALWSSLMPTRAFAALWMLIGDQTLFHKSAVGKNMLQLNF